MKIEKYGTAGDIDELIAVKESIDRLANAHGSSSPVVARADLHDTGDSYLVLVEVPGVSQADLEVAVQGDELLVAGIRDGILADATPVFTERPVGPFQRTIRLPSSVDPEQVTAHLQAGLLTINLPKA